MAYSSLMRRDTNSFPAESMQYEISRIRVAVLPRERDLSGREIALSGRTFESLFTSVVGLDHASIMPRSFKEIGFRDWEIAASILDEELFNAGQFIACASTPGNRNFNFGVFGITDFKAIHPHRDHREKSKKGS